jgi:hypothetical protein
MQHVTDFYLKFKSNLLEKRGKQKTDVHVPLEYKNLFVSMIGSQLPNTVYASFN